VIARGFSTIGMTFLSASSSACLGRNRLYRYIHPMMTNTKAKIPALTPMAIPIAALLPLGVSSPRSGVSALDEGAGEKVLVKIVGVFDGSGALEVADDFGLIEELGIGAVEVSGNLGAVEGLAAGVGDGLGDSGGVEGLASGVGEALGDSSAVDELASGVGDVIGNSGVVEELATGVGEASGDSGAAEEALALGVGEASADSGTAEELALTVEDASVCEAA